jgi:hypothetical protein
MYFVRGRTGFDPVRLAFQMCSNRLLSRGSYIERFPTEENFGEWYNRMIRAIGRIVLLVQSTRILRVPCAELEEQIEHRKERAYSQCLW